MESEDVSTCIFCDFCAFLRRFNDGIFESRRTGKVVNLASKRSQGYDFRMATKDSASEFPRGRRSASAQAGVEKERERILSMTVEERILEALSIQHTMSDFIEVGQHSKSCPPHRH